MQNSLRVGITHGDYNGVGYEIIFKALAEDMMTDLMTPIVFGSSELAAATIRECGLEGVHFTRINSAADARPGRINIVEASLRQPTPTPGHPSKDAGEAAALALEAGACALETGDIDVLVTAPIDKNTIHSESFPFTGHTEWLQSRFGGDEDRSLMVLFNDEIRVALVTVHEPIAKVAGLITKEAVLEKIKEFDASLRKDFGSDRPLIAVLGLNPHCGDSGLIGDEEQTAIIPAIEAAKEEGLLPFGPFAADGFFASGAYKKFDGVLAMYHDQGLAPFKALAGQSGVNFTAGLKIVRTSPDHGTAYDLAGRGEADCTSMREAIYKALEICRNRRRWEEMTANPLPISKPARESSK